MVQAKLILYYSGAGVPCVPGYHGDNQDPDFLYAQAQQIGGYLSICVTTSQLT